MGINSTEVSYGFGQMGSSYHNNLKPIYPPKDHVIIAIQFLSSNKLAVLETELMGTGGSQFITTATSEAVENNYLGVTEAAVASATLTTVNITDDTVQIADVIANRKIKPGQYVLLVNDTDTLSGGLTVDSAAAPDGTPTPIYKGPSSTGVKVVSIANPTGGTHGTHVTLSRKITPTTSQTLVFLDEHHGAGSTDIVDAVFPTGMTIFGRWTKAQLGTSDAAGGAIFYFGK